MRHVEELIIRHFSDDDLSAQERSGMVEHLRSCEMCRQQYDQLALLLRASAGAEPTRQEMAAWRRGVEEALDPTPAPGAEPRRGWLFGGLLLRLAPVAAVAALVAMVVVARQQPADKIPDVQFRGSHAGGQGGGESDVPPPVLVNLEVHAIRASEGQSVQVRRLADGDSVALDEYIQFSGVCSGAGIKHLYLLGLDHELRPLDYYPRPSRPQSIAYEPCTTKPRVIGRSIRLARRHVAGSWRVVALFSREPLTRASVHGILIKARASRVAGTDLARLNFGAGVHAVVRSFVLTERKP